MKHYIIYILMLLVALPVYAQDNHMHSNHHTMGQMDMPMHQIVMNKSLLKVCPYSVMTSENTELIGQYQNKTYHFCNPDIARLFNNNPKYYESKIKTINLNASQFKFDPAKITINKGDIVQLLVTSKDVTHGIYIKAYKINIPIKKGEKKVIEFIANKSGIFTILCSVYCGSGHHKMKATLVVK